MTASAARRRTEALWGPNGLAPAIVQDARDGRVLMLGWMDEEAWRVTHDTGKVHFHSRTRDRLWRKGESSGHELLVHEIALDCDADAILVSVDPIGPTCHRGTRSCFDDEDAPPDRAPQGFAWLEDLWSTIAQRAADRPEGSYTAELLVTSIDRDGTRSGYDIELLRAISSRVEVPVIASGGAAGPEHLIAAIREGGADAVLAASIFHRRIHSIEEVKAAMAAAGLPVRLPDAVAA